MKSVQGALAVLASFLIYKKAVAAGATSLVAGVSAYVAGIDPLPWVLATAGMVYMLVRTDYDENKSPKEVRKDALANGIVSLICGGLGGPWTAVAVEEYINPRLGSPLLMAFLISAFWQLIAFRALPALIPVVKDVLISKRPW